MEKVEFQTNIPQIVSLQFSEGKPVKSQFHDREEIMFTCTDGRRMFLAGFVADLIREAGIEAKTPFSICRREVERGKIRFEVKSLAAVKSLEARSLEVRADARLASAPRGTSSSVASVTPTQPNSSLNPVTADPEPPRVARESLHLMSCFLCALDAVSEAQQYCSRKGIGITFSSDNVTSAALSCFINDCKSGSR